MNNTPRVLFRATAVAAAILCCGQSRAQTTTAPAAAPAPATAPEDEPILLNQFTVSAEKMGRFSSTEATSGTRVATDLFSSSQSISVVTREAIEDVSAARVLDAAKYVSGVSESTIPNGLDRITIRGFQTDGQTIDGFQNGGMVNLDPVFIDRIEVVKGPNAVLAPSGSPGGTINNVTRKPELKNKEEVAGSWGLYDGFRTEFDVNQYRSLKNDDKVAFRVVGAATDNSDGWRSAKSHWIGAMPGFMYQTKAGTQVIVQGIFFSGRSTNDLGIPVDPSSGTDNDAKILSGLSRTTSTAGNAFRFERRNDVRASITTPLTENLSMRVAARYNYGDAAFCQRIAGISGTSKAGGSYDPTTGHYVPGLAYAVDAAGNVTSSPIPAYDWTHVGASTQWQKSPGGAGADFQNDYAHKLDLSFVKLSTVGGVYYKYTKSITDNYAMPTEYFNFNNLSAWNPDVQTTGIALTNNANTSPALVNAQNISVTTTQIQQAYLTESAALWDGKIILNGSIAYDNIDGTYRNPTNTWSYNGTTYVIPSLNQNNDRTLKSYGIVIKPIEQVSAYYSYSELATPAGIDTSNPMATYKVQFGKSKEFGVRFQGFDKRIYVTVARFDITQDNFTIPNPANLVFPVPSPLLPNLYTDVTDKGWEFETRLALTKQLSIIGNYSVVKYRTKGSDAETRGATPNSGALLLNYTFEKGSSLSGFAIGFGADYRGRTPGDNGGSALAFSYSKPSFYLGARTIYNLMLSYKINEHLKTQLTVDNIFDTKYIESSVSRGAVYPGVGIDPNLKITYAF